MGLDMYLNRHKYVENWDHTPSDRKFKISITQGDKKISSEKLKYLVFEEMYWRKANWIHAWFVENVQDGNDDCATYYVSTGKLQELNAIITEILALKNKLGKLIEVIMEKLPPKGGFFFGSTDIDDEEFLKWYIEVLEETKECFDNLTEEDELYYSSSW